MNGRPALRLIGLARAATGLFFVIRPDAAARRWVASGSDEVALLARSVGIRDLVVGLGLAATARPEWLAASIASDLVDGIEAVSGDVPGTSRVGVATVALGFAAVSAAVAARAWVPSRG
jgi:hypothetical protein